MLPDTIAIDAEKPEDSKTAVGSVFDIRDLGPVEQWNNMSSKDQEAFEKKLVRKLDLRLIPWLTVLYLISFLDRANIGNAKIQGVLLLRCF
jgi:hypothetical protein